MSATTVLESVSPQKQTRIGAGHFITFENGESERLHGHNYRVAVEVTGPLTGTTISANLVVVQTTLDF